MTTSHPGRQVALVQRLICCGLLALAVTWAACFLRLGRPLWALAGVAAIGLGHALFLGFEFLALTLVHGDDAVERPSGLSILLAWACEVQLAPRVFCWRQPFRAELEPDNLPADNDGQRGVVLVHGFFCNRGFWNPWMKRFRSLNIRFVAVNLEPIFGSIDEFIGAVDSAVARVESATGRAPVVVGHSMGGLVVRAWLARPGSSTRVHRVVTIGTPHQGTWLARFGHARSALEMRIGSAWLSDLRRRETAPTHYSRFTCFFSNTDNVVFPASTATLPGADNRSAHGSAHIQMAYRKPVFDHVCASVASTAAVAQLPDTTVRQE